MCYHYGNVISHCYNGSSVVFTSPACAITGIVTAGVVGCAGLIGFGLAVYHGCNEIPSELSEPASIGVAPEPVIS